MDQAENNHVNPLLHSLTHSLTHTMIQIMLTRKMVSVIVRMPNVVFPWVGAGDVELWCPVLDYPLAVTRKMTEKMRRNDSDQHHISKAHNTRKMDASFMLFKRCEQLRVGTQITFRGRLFRPKLRLGYGSPSVFYPECLLLTAPGCLQSELHSPHTPIPAMLSLSISS